MKHTGSILKFAVAPCIAILLFALTLLAKPEPAQPAEVQAGQGMALQPPAFLKSAHAAGLAQVDFEFILEEAGVTAYTKLDQELELESLESRFKIIRQQTEEFISGIVIAPGYEKLSEFDESAEVQVFLHRDGWIVGYLTRYQATSVIFDWINYDEKRLTETLIESVVRTLALDVGVSDFTVSHYDFRYPEATNLVLAADRIDSKTIIDSFEVIIPRRLSIYESSWSHFNSGGYSRCYLDDEDMSTIYQSGSGWQSRIGELTSSELSFDTPHKFQLGGEFYMNGNLRIYCGIAIVYQEAAK